MNDNVGTGQVSKTRADLTRMLQSYVAAQEKGKFVRMYFIKLRAEKLLYNLLKSAIEKVATEQQYEGSSFRKWFVAIESWDLFAHFMMQRSPGPVTAETVKADAERILKSLQQAWMGRVSPRKFFARSKKAIAA